MMRTYFTVAKALDVMEQSEVGGKLLFDRLSVVGVAALRQLLTEQKPDLLRLPATLRDNGLHLTLSYPVSTNGIMYQNATETIDTCFIEDKYLRESEK